MLGDRVRFAAPPDRRRCSPKQVRARDINSALTLMVNNICGRSMRPWESAPAKARLRDRFPRSHGPPTRKEWTPMVKERLNPRAFDWNAVIGSERSLWWSGEQSPQTCACASCGRSTTAARAARPRAACGQPVGRVYVAGGMVNWWCCVWLPVLPDFEPLAKGAGASSTAAPNGAGAGRSLSGRSANDSR